MAEQGRGPSSIGDREPNSLLALPYYHYRFGAANPFNSNVDTRCGGSKSTIRIA